MQKKSDTSIKPTPAKDLALLFSVPIGIALLAAVIVYTPRFFANPSYDFIYAHCADYRCRNAFTVGSGGQIQQKNPSDDSFYETEDLRYYDASEDASRNLTVEDAEQYQLLNSSKSPDGYVVEREESSSGFLFWGEYSEGWYMKNGLKKKQIQLANDTYYSDSINFLGWVK